MEQRHFDEFVEVWATRGEEFFTERFRWHVLVGLYIMGELDDNASRGGGMTFNSKVNNESGTVSLKRRIFPIRKRDYGPDVKFVRLGRLKDSNDIIVPEYTVSTIHAEFIQRAGELFIRDLGSFNGTWVNGDRIPAEEAVRLTDEAEVVIGRVKFEYLTRETFWARLDVASKSPLLATG